MRTLTISGVCLAVLFVVVAWREWRYYRLPVRYLIRTGGQRRWMTRPRVLRNKEEFARMGEVVERLEAAGLAPVKVCMFLGRPTMDLILEPNDRTRKEIEAIVAGFDVRVDVFRRNVLPLRYH